MYNIINSTTGKYYQENLHLTCNALIRFIDFKSSNHLEQYHRKALLSTFHLNGNTLGFRTQLVTVKRLSKPGCSKRSLKSVYFYYQALKDDLEKQQASLKDSASLAEDLLSVSDDPVSAAELQSRLSRAELELNQLAQKVEERKDKLQAALSQSGQFETDFDDILRWLTKTERTVAKLRPISADSSTVQEQQESYQVCLYLFPSSRNFVSLSFSSNFHSTLAVSVVKLNQC